MSITFSCLDAPHRFVPCEFCGSTPKEYLVNGRCDAYCDGTQVESDSPQINLSGSSAASLLHAMGLPVVEYGTIEVEAIPPLMGRLLRFANIEQERAPLLEEPREEYGAQGARCISFGTSDDALVRRAQSMQTLLTFARENGFQVTWG